MRIALQPAFILHHRPYRETSMLLDLFTKEYGRITLVAKGVRTARSRLRSLLQPFVPLLVSWQGRGDLMNLQTIEGDGMPIRLHGNCLLSGFYLNELMMRVLAKQDAHSRLYVFYQQAIAELEHAISPEKILRFFEKNLLEELGYGLQLKYDISNGNIFIPEKKYKFYSEQGFMLCDENEKIGIFSGESILALAAEQLDSKMHLNDAKRLMRLALIPLIGVKPLQTRRLFHISPLPLVGEG